MDTSKAFNPCYDVYREIISDVKASGKGCNYKEALNRKTFVIMRHDVEFSIERAHALSLVETDMDFCSTYFIQITNNTYNAFSKKSIDMLRDMANRGHIIGLHYHLNGQTDISEVRDGVRDQLRIMSEMIGLNVDSYSFHRPTKELEYYNIRIPGTINAYSSEYFSYCDKVNENARLEVKYIADSKHRWNYGYPDLDTFNENSKVQILIHPFSWNSGGGIVYLIISRL